MSDLDRSIEFYRDIVGLTLALELPERGGAAFFWSGGAGEAMLGLWSLGSAPIGLALHIALKVSVADVLGACNALRSNGVTPLLFFGTETTEPSVIAWMPAAAVYFRDPDSHLIEYLSMLKQPPRADGGIISWSDWTSADPGGEPVHVERYNGPRTELRALFEEAEDSSPELDSYIDAGEILVATTEGRVVGHHQLIDNPGAHETEIKNMAVDRAYRGRGIGRMLLETAIDLTRARGDSTLAVATAAADVGNLRFYQLAGFRMRTVQRDAFTAMVGYPAGLMANGIQVRDRVWLDLQLNPART